MLRVVSVFVYVDVVDIVIGNFKILCIGIFANILFLLIFCSVAINIFAEQALFSL